MRIDGTAREAAYLSGKYYDSEQLWEAAARAYHASLRCSGAWDGDERGYWRGGFSYYMSGEPSRADSIWYEGASLFPGGYWEDEMLFWRARTHSEGGDDDGSRRLLAEVADGHPWEFYGMLAGMRLGLQEPAFDWMPPAVPLGESDEEETIQAAVKMVSQGYGSLAVEVLMDRADPLDGTRAYYLAVLGEYGPCLTTLRLLDTDLRELEGRILDSRWLPLYFPLPYRELILAESADLEVPSAALTGVIREESYFSRFVTSVAGARGLIQLMPGTAYDVARWYGLPQLTGDQFHDPYSSVRYGMIYIDRQYRSFGGEYPLFLAAYNAGPGNASRWRDGHGYASSDPELFIEQITYRETRIYVKKVLRSNWLYDGRLR